MKHAAPPGRAARVRMVQRFFPTRTLGLPRKRSPGVSLFRPCAPAGHSPDFMSVFTITGRGNDGILLRGSHALLPFPENGKEKDIMNLRLPDEGAATEEDTCISRDNRTDGRLPSEIPDSVPRLTRS